MSNRKRVSLYIMNMVDIVSLLIAFLISYEIRRVLPMRRLITWEDVIPGYRFQQFPYMPLLFVTIISYILVNFLFLYSEEYLSRNVSAELLATLKMIVMVIVVDVLILYITKTSERYSRIFMVIFFVIAYFICFILREAVKKLYIPRYKNGKASEKMVVVCRECDVDHILEQLNAIIDWRFHITGLVITDADRAGEYISGIRVISNFSDAMEKLQKEEVDSILLVSGDPEEKKAWVRHFQPLGKTVHVSLPEFELSDTKRMQDMLGQCAVISYLPEIPLRGRNVVMKRSLDIILSILLLPFVLVVMLIVTLLTKLFLKGPVFVTRVRVGMNGRRFNQYHFRVYRMDADQRKKDGKSPYTWLGRFLDRTRISSMKRGAVLINTARGPLVDTDALIEALETGHLSAAGLDVFDGDRSIYYRDFKNTPVSSRQKAILDAMPNVLMLPHMAYFTDQAMEDMVTNSVQAVAQYLQEKE